jgi:hypothetical protein
MAMSLRPISFQLSSNTFEGLSAGFGAALAAAWACKPQAEVSTMSVTARSVTGVFIGDLRQSDCFFFEIRRPNGDKIKAILLTASSHKTLQHAHIPLLISWFIHRRLRHKRAMVEARIVQYPSERLQPHRPFADVRMPVEL